MAAAGGMSRSPAPHQLLGPRLQPESQKRASVGSQPTVRSDPTQVSPPGAVPSTSILCPWELPGPSRPSAASGPARPAEAREAPSEAGPYLGPTPRPSPVMTGGAPGGLRGCVLSWPEPSLGGGAGTAGDMVSRPRLALFAGRLEAGWASAALCRVGPGPLGRGSQVSCSGWASSPALGIDGTLGLNGLSPPSAASNGPFDWGRWSPAGLATSGPRVRPVDRWALLAWGGVSSTELSPQG